MLPALVLIFDPEVTSLGHFTHLTTCHSQRTHRCPALWRVAHQNEKPPGPHGYVPPSGRPYFPGAGAPDFPIRNQKLKVPLPYGCSQFGTVSSESHWQALCHVSHCAFHG